MISEFLADAPEQMQDLLTRRWPADWAHDPDTVHDARIEILRIATLGTLLALILAMPVGVLAAHNLVPSMPLNLAGKLILAAVFAVVILAELIVTQVRKRVR